MSLESLEFWKTAFEIGGVVLLLLTFIAGAGVLWFSKRVNAVQAEQLRQFDKGLTEAKTELGKQQERAAKAEAALEHEAMTRLELERALAPRRFPFRFENGKSNLDELKRFAGMRVSIEHVDELEPKRTAWFLRDALANSGWKVTALETLPDAPPFTGIAVESHISSRKSASEIPAADKAAHEAAAGLVKWLTDNNIEAGHNIQANMPLDLVRIRVGLKPDPWVFGGPPERLLPKK